MNKKEFDRIYENTLLKIALDCTYDGCSFTDENGNVLYCNPAYYRITGIPTNRIVGENVNDLVHQGFPVSAMTLEVMKSMRPLSRIIQYSNDYGTLDCFVTMVPAYDKNNKFIGTVANYRDLAGLQEMSSTLNDVILTYNAIIQKNDTEKMELWNQMNVLRFDANNMNIYGNSKIIKNLLDLAHRIAHTDSTVLITGESGVGKDVFCQMIHSFDGPSKPFIKISCSAIPENLLESELFGYEPGAFTGASKKGKPGIFELASGGIVFLDEIGEMSLNLQVKLLTVLQDKRFFHVGGTQEHIMDARIIAATNRDLKLMIADGSFRADLYYRLNVIPVYVPPLRERREDILPIANGILNRLNEKNNTQKVLSSFVENAMRQYDWPGNIRELNNLVERMYVLSQNYIIGPDVLPTELMGLVSEPSIQLDTFVVSSGTLKNQVEQYEKKIIEYALKENISVHQIAKKLGMHVSTLERKIKKYGIKSRYVSKK